MTAPSQLGDCLKHGEHHLMDQGCIEVMIGFISNLMNKAGMQVEEAIQWYSHAYEREVLHRQLKRS